MSGDSMAPVQLPRPDNSDIVRLLQLVWDRLDDAERWPTFGVIERSLWREHRIDAAELIARTPPEFLRGGRAQGGAAPAPNGELALTVPGAAACAGSDAVLEVVVTAARLAAEAYLSESPAAPAVTYEQVLREFPAELQDDRELLRRSGLLLAQEPWPTQTSRNEEGWTIQVDGRIRYYADVQSVEDYWRAREEQRLATESASEVYPAIQQETIAGQDHLESDAPDTADDAAPEVAAADPPSRNSHPVMEFLTIGLASLGVIAAVIQATEALWAQVAGSVLVALGMCSLYVSWRQWYRRPRARNASIGTAGLCAITTAVVLIAGNASGDTPSSAETPVTTPTSPPTSIATSHGTAAITVEPRQGRAGRSVFISARGFAANEVVRIEIFNGAQIKDFQGPYQIADTQANRFGEISVQGTIPAELCCPKGHVLVRATGRSSKSMGETPFTLN